MFLVLSPNIFGSSFEVLTNAINFMELCKFILFANDNKFKTTSCTQFNDSQRIYINNLHSKYRKLKN